MVWWNAFIQLKTAIKSSSNVKKWSEQLPIVLLGIRSTIKEELKCTPTELVYGQTLRLPGDLIVKTNNVSTQDEVLQSLRNHFDSVRSEVIHHSNSSKVFVPKDLFSCEYVFVKILRPNGLECPYEGPYKVIERNTNTYKVQCNNIIKSYTIDRLKPAHIENAKETHNIIPNQNRTFHIH